MSPAAMRDHVQPERRFLSDVYADVLDLAVLQKIFATLVDQEFCVLEQVALMSDEPIGPGAVGLFVGDRKKNNVTVEFDFFALQHYQNNELGEAFVLHVLRAASPEIAVFDFAAEGRNFPVLRI